MNNTIKGITDDIKKNDPETMKKFKEVFSRHLRHFSVRTGKDKSSYYFIIQVPSVKVPRGKKSQRRALYYDVVIQVLNPRGSVKNVFDKPIRFFSNSPSFTFTYAYVFNKNGLLIPWLKGKYGTRVLDNRPKVRNPEEKIALDQSIKMALLYLDRTYNHKNMEENSFSVKRLFRGTINQRNIYNNIDTGLEKKDENKSVRENERTKEERRDRIFSTLKNPLGSRKPTGNKKSISNEGRNISTSKRDSSTKKPISRTGVKPKKRAKRTTRR